jgi:hypothetical protein
MSADGFLRRTHRVISILFLLSIPPAAYYSFTGDRANPSPVVYLPLFPLFGLMLTGTYLLVRPWVLRWRARGLPARQTKAGSKS